MFFKKNVHEKQVETTHLGFCIQFYAQCFYTFQNFPFEEPINQWTSTKTQYCVDSGRQMPYQWRHLGFYLQFVKCPYYWNQVFTCKLLSPFFVGAILSLLTYNVGIIWILFSLPKLRIQICHQLVVLKNLVFCWPCFARQGYCVECKFSPLFSKLLNLLVFQQPHT